ncbi:hypothetical protein [Sporosarcina sp. FSL W7-1283]|uniref:hypothetical protein n=1 Tax=Sporosarcina sp. FSL W7-1283 TaxID=2921560 RepID=UPI0030F57E9A
MSNEEEKERIQIGEVKKLEELSPKDQIKLKVEQKEISLGQAVIELCYLAEELFVTPTCEVYATISIRDIMENIRLEEELFKKWLRKEYLMLFKKPLNDQALKTAINGVVASVELESENIKEVYIRNAEKDGKFYIDLANNAREIIEVSQNGWKIVSQGEVPVKFYRPFSMKEMKKPVRNGNVNELKRFVNVEEDEWVLLVSYILAIYYGKGPFPIAVFQGLAGSGKTNHMRLLKKLTDPHVLEIASLPKDEESMIIRAQQTLLLTYDNISMISAECSDSLCKIATGAGLSTRELFTNGKEFSLSATRPIMLNGISSLVERADLASRSIIFSLPNLSSKRKSERELWREFEEAIPRIFGGFLDVLCKTLNDLPHTTLVSLPRMADFSLLSSAAEKHFGFSEGSFLKAFESNHKKIATDALEENLIGLAIKNCLMEKGTIEGTATELLNILKTYVPVEDLKSGGWISSNRLKSAMERLKPTLEQNGIYYEYIRRNDVRLHKMYKL